MTPWFRSQEWPKDKVPVGAITTWEDIEDRRPRTAIFQRRTTCWMAKFLARRGKRKTPFPRIPEGMRLKTVSVDAE